jgi:tRNA isopentenyl-2-thiomethyl-A-37 hydroxylase MiaE
MKVYIVTVLEFNPLQFLVAEELRRFSIFQENMMKARKMEAMELGTARYGATKFSDLTGKNDCFCSYSHYVIILDLQSLYTQQR